MYDGQKLFEEINELIVYRAELEDRIESKQDVILAGMACIELPIIKEKINNLLKYTKD